MSKNKYIQLFAFVFLLSLFACQEDEAPRPFFYGNYNLQTISMDRAMDLNNDGEASSDFLSQVVDGSGNPGNRLTLLSSEMDEMQFSLFYPNELTVQSGVPIIRFPIENQLLTVVFAEETNAFAILRMQPLVPQAGQIIAINLIDRSTIDIEVNKSLYDFSNAEWLETMVTYRFVRGLINA
ncbi:hypothetical protein [Cecembia sp.]|uniref:hypothetical protein n=1 Tax=Cecembia sp. TaxID=1898110 RepID=UPI0025C6BB99|nr:hypothetical protein [Cecembia sp.]